jgi:hypothetical protein
MINIPILAESSSTSEFGLFSSEFGGGVVISQEEMRNLSRTYSKLYEVYISSLSSRLKGSFGISESAANVLVRHAFVPLMFCFMDRLVRINKLLSESPGSFSLPYQCQPPSFELIEEFQELSVGSPEFNQYLIWFVGRIWKLPEVDLSNKKVLYKNQTSFKNNLFRLYRRTPVRLFKKLYISLLSLVNRPQLPVLTMSNMTGALHHYGFYAKYLGDLNFSLLTTEVKIDNHLREKLFTDDLISTSELNDFLDSLGLGEVEKKRSLVLFKEFIRTHYPTSLLEAIPRNIRSALDVLSPFESSVLLSSGGRSTSATYIFAAAKQKGKFIVDFQHGGHYGYVDEMRQMIDLEYPGVDQFVSWGWSHAPQQLTDTSLSIISLPSPWLSERKQYWRRLLNVNANKKYDFLLMSTKAKRFPEAPQGASLGRIDLIQNTAESLKNLVTKITSNKFTILHKPCDVTTVKLLSKTMSELEIIGGERYDVVEQLDKGLTYDLLNKCRVVIWDQPGTGFLECLSAGIPTMLNWTRISVQEEEWAKPIFHDLEKIGIIHRDVDTLVTEMEKFKESPELWMSNPARVALVNRFCRQFAWVSKDWPRYWRKYFDELTEFKKA